MTWVDTIDGIDALDGCDLAPDIVAGLEQSAAVHPWTPLALATPSFMAHSTGECCGAGRDFPVFSVTGAACALQCDHCRGRILDGMIPALTPDDLDAKVRGRAKDGRLAGFLLSGGSNRRNEIAYERYYRVIERLKRDYPRLEIAIHSGLVDKARARAMADAGVDVAMMDVIGAQETIAQVYHLDRTVDDFAASLEALAVTSMTCVPHIVAGLHYGRMLGEPRALEICAATGVDSLVLVVVMPIHAEPGLFVAPPLAEVARLMTAARQSMGARPVHLGCARPFGLYRRALDAYAVMAGLESIAFPSEGVLELARAIGRPLLRHGSCCAFGRAAREIATVPA